MTLPAVIPASLDDTSTLRWAVRSDGERGFLFVNNYQRIEGLPDHPGVQFEVALAGETLTLPAAPVSIPSGMYAIWPLNFNLGNVLLKYATAQPICKVDGPGGPCFIFFAQDGLPAEFVFDAGSLKRVEGPARQVSEAGTLRLEDMKPGPGCLLRITPRTGQAVSVLLLSQAEARQVYKANLWGQERIFLSADSLLFDDDTLRIQTRRTGTLDVSVFPDPGQLSIKDGSLPGCTANGVFTRYSIEIPALDIPLETVRTQTAAPARAVPIGPAGVAQAPEDADFDGAETWQVTLPPGAFDNVEELFLSIEYTGDVARAYLADRLIDDDFYHTHAAWEIGLRRFSPGVLRDGLTLRFLPIRKDAPVYIDPQALPDFGEEEEVVRVKSITAIPQFQVVIGWESKVL